jgi:thiol-disulfide isomerase/thioredoxin
MSFACRTSLAGFVIFLGYLLSDGSSTVPARGTSADEFDKTEVLLSNHHELTTADEMDTSAKSAKAHRKVYKVQFTEGKSYRIELISNDFDTLLRLENSDGKEVALNDGVTPPHHNTSRILFYAPRTGEYRVIVTSLVQSAERSVPPTGSFTIQVNSASAAESAKAQRTHQLEVFAASSPDAQRKQMKESTRNLIAKGDKLTLTEAQEVFEWFMAIEESNDLARETGLDLAKLFRGTSNRQIVALARIVDQEVAKLEQFGKELEITGMTTDGKKFDLKDLKGKVVLVDCWATWCAPCVAEIPNIVGAHRKYKAKGFEVIGVSLDRTDQDIVRFLESRDIPWQCLTSEDSAQLAEKLGVRSIPCAILIGRDGRVVSMRARGPKLERLLTHLIEE